MTKAEFVGQANRICGENNDFLRQALIDAFGPDQAPDGETGIRFTRDVWVPNLRKQAEDLRALEWPPDDRQKIEAMFREVDRQTDRVEAEPWIASEGPFDEVTHELADYGIESCGSP